MSIALSEGEYQLLEHQYLISRTDLDSKISYVNQTFIEVSAYTEAELLGSTNELFRHPDMPSAVFDDIWATLKAGKIWSGIMKHRRKGGAFFWAQATISPMLLGARVVGYTTARTRPNPALLSQAAAAYALMRGPGPVRGLRIFGGSIRRTGLAGWGERIASPTICARPAALMLCSAAGTAVPGSTALLRHDRRVPGSTTVRRPAWRQLALATRPATAGRRPRAVPQSQRRRFKLAGRGAAPG